MYVHKLNFLRLVGARFGTLEACKFVLPEVILAWAAAARRCLARVSLGSSCVSNTGHTWLANRRIHWPSFTVNASKILTVELECSRSLASACHVASTKIRSRMILSCAGGSRPSNAGKAHCESTKFEMRVTGDLDAEANLEYVFKVSSCKLLHS